MGTRLFVGNLSYSVNEQDLKEAFLAEGIEVRSVRVALDRETGRPRGFAFVETDTDAGAKASIEKLVGRLLQGRPLMIEEAQARPAGGPPRPGGPGGPPPGPGGPPRTFGSAPPRFGGPGGAAPGGGGGAPRFGGPGGAPGMGGPPRPFGAPRPGGPPPSLDARAGDKPRPERRERPEKKRSTRPKPEERERGNWRWKGVIDED